MPEVFTTLQQMQSLHTQEASLEKADGWGLSPPTVDTYYLLSVNSNFEMKEGKGSEILGNK